MVEVGQGDLLPALLGMALGAVGSEATGMGIAMAIRAGGKRNRGVPCIGIPVRPVDRSAMTPITRDLSVFANQRKARVLVPEKTPLGPLHETVAILAPATFELTPMLVGVTGTTARPVESQKGSVQVLVLPEQRLLVPDERLLVTASASQIRMGTLELERSLLVVEGRLALIAPKNELEIAAVVLHVAALTALLQYRDVVPVALLDAAAQQLVTVQTELGRDSLLLAVALQASIAALELGVGCAQWTRRDLGFQGLTPPPAKQRQGQETKSDVASTHWGDHP